MGIHRIGFCLRTFPVALTALVSILISFGAPTAKGQSPNHRLHFPSTTFTLPPNAQFLEKEAFRADANFPDGKAYKLIEFERISTDAEKASLEGMGLHLRQCIRNDGWLASIDPAWKRSSARTDHDYSSHASMDIMAGIAGKQANIWCQRTVGFAADLETDDININTLPQLAFGADRLAICAGDTIQLTDSSSNNSTWLWSVSGGAFAFVNGTNSSSINPDIVLFDPVAYSVTLQGSNAFGVDSLVKSNYINAGNHTVSLVATDTSICLGDAVTFSASFAAAEKYIFAVSGNTLQNSPLSTYTNTGLADGDVLSVFAQLYPGCHTDTAQLTMTVAEPIVGMFTFDNSLCPVISFFGSSSGGDPDLWFWNFGDWSGTTTGQNPVHDYSFSGNGNYMVRLITENACGRDTMFQPISISCIVSASQGLLGAMQVFPNPTSGTVRIQAPVWAGGSYSLSLTDMHGKVTWAKGIVSATDRLEVTLDLGVLASGMYYLVLRGSEGEMRAKVVVE